MSRLALILVPALTLACVSTATPEPAPRPQDGKQRVEKLLAKAVAWQGGRKTLAAIRYVQIPRLAVTVHGAADGAATQITLKGLTYGLKRDKQPERLRFHLTTPAGSRTMGFDGKRYWLRRRNFAAHLSPKREEHKADIDRMDQALDILRYLFLPDVIAEGTPFESRGRGKAGRGKTTVELLRKLDGKKREAALLLREDGSVYSVGRVETIEVPDDKNGNGKADPGEGTEKRFRDLRVYPRLMVKIAVPGTDGGKVKLPTRVEIHANGRPWITAVVEGKTPFRILDPKNVNEKIFRKKK